MAAHSTRWRWVRRATVALVFGVWIGTSHATTPWPALAAQPADPHATMTGGAAAPTQTTAATRGRAAIPGQAAAPAAAMEPPGPQLGGATQPTTLATPGAPAAAGTPIVVNVPARGDELAGGAALVASGTSCDGGGTISWQLSEQGHPVGSGTTSSGMRCPALGVWKVTLGILEPGRYTLLMHQTGPSGVPATADVSTPFTITVPIAPPAPPPTAAPAPTPVPQSGPAVFFTPHQDDETLTMGSDIRAQYLAGRQVVVVDVTDGAGSIVRQDMCANRGICLTGPQFTDARNLEQAASISLLAPTARVLYENYPDRTLTVAQATTVITKYVGLYPSGSFATMSWLDTHPDHIALGTALRALCNAGRIPGGDCRFEQSRPCWAAMPVASLFVIGDDAVVAALKQFGVWNPAAGRYDIGVQSVPSSFADAELDPLTKYHGS